MTKNRMKKIRNALISRIEAMPSMAIFSLCLIITALVGIGDYWMGTELTSSIFYVISISIGAWFVNGRVGALLALISTLVWLYSDHASGKHYSHVAIQCWNALVTLGLFMFISFIMASLKKRLEIEIKLAGLDPLTDALNRRSFYERAEQEVSRSRRHGHPLSIAYIDLDNFKRVNDVHGHYVGDDLLQKVVSIMHSNTRKQDLVARLGGDEFAILFAEADSRDSKQILNKLWGLLTRYMQENEWPVTFSIGLVSYECPPADLKQLLLSADASMYMAKNNSKNTIIQKAYDAHEKEVMMDRNADFTSSSA